MGKQGQILRVNWPTVQDARKEILVPVFQAKASHQIFRHGVAGKV